MYIILFLYYWKKLLFDCTFHLWLVHTLRESCLWLLVDSLTTAVSSIRYCIDLFHLSRSSFVRLTVSVFCDCLLFNIIMCSLVHFLDGARWWQSWHTDISCCCRCWVFVLIGWILTLQWEPGFFHIAGRGICVFVCRVWESVCTCFLWCIYLSCGTSTGA